MASPGENDVAQNQNIENNPMQSRNAPALSL